MKKIFILLGLMLVCLYISAQNPTYYKADNYTYLSTTKSGSVFYQWDTIVSPVGTDTTITFEGFLSEPSTLFFDGRLLDANDSEIDVGTRGLNMDTIFLSLDTLNFPLVLDLTIFTEKVIGTFVPSCYAPELLIKYTKGSATAGLKFPVQLFTPR